VNVLIKSIALIIAAMSLSGCQTNMSQAGIEFDNLKNSFAKVRGETDVCFESVYATTDAGKVVASQIMFAKQESPNKFDLLTNNSKLNDAQKSSLKEFLAVSQRCRDILLRGISSFHGAHANNQRLYYSKLDAIYVALLNGDFTVADANKAKEKAISELQSMAQDIHNQDRQRWQAMDAQENADRSARAAILLPMLMQQQQIQAQQQQNMYNQQMNQINSNRPVYVPPAYTPPVTTNCTTFGNQVQCTSR
jgi:hypothetical protein